MSVFKYSDEGKILSEAEVITDHSKIDESLYYSFVEVKNRSEEAAARAQKKRSADNMMLVDGHDDVEQRKREKFMSNQKALAESWQDIEEKLIAGRAELHYTVAACDAFAEHILTAEHAPRGSGGSGDGSLNAAPSSSSSSSVTPLLRRSLAMKVVSGRATMKAAALKLSEKSRRLRLAAALDARFTRNLMILSHLWPLKMSRHHAQLRGEEPVTVQVQYSPIAEPAALLQTSSGAAGVAFADHRAAALNLRIHLRVESLAVDTSAAPPPLDGVASMGGRLSQETILPSILPPFPEQQFQALASSLSSSSPACSSSTSSSPVEESSAVLRCSEALWAARESSLVQKCIANLWAEARACTRGQALSLHRGQRELQIRIPNLVSSSTFTILTLSEFRVDENDGDAKGSETKHAASTLSDDFIEGFSSVLFEPLRRQVAQAGGDLLGPTRLSASSSSTSSSAYVRLSNWLRRQQAIDFFRAFGPEKVQFRLLDDDRITGEIRRENRPIARFSLDSSALVTSYTNLIEPDHRNYEIMGIVDLVQEFH